MSDRIKVAKILFSLGAGLGILAVGAACLFGAAYNRHAPLLPVILNIFVPFSVLWSLFCYCAYRGLTSTNVLLRTAFGCSSRSTFSGFRSGPQLRAWPSGYGAI